VEFYTRVTSLGQSGQNKNKKERPYELRCRR